MVTKTKAFSSLCLNLGMVVLSPGAIRVLVGNNELPTAYLQRHESGDWGDIGDEDKSANDAAVGQGDPDRQGRVLSAYRTRNGTRIWILSEADRSSTTILLPEEY